MFIKNLKSIFKEYYHMVGLAIEMLKNIWRKDKHE